MDATIWASNDFTTTNWSEAWNSLGGGMDPAVSPTGHLADLGQAESTDQHCHPRGSSFAESCHKPIRENSIPVEELMTEVLWPYQPLSGSQQECSASLSDQSVSQPSLGISRAYQEVSAQSEPINCSISQTKPHCDRPKRKRGRPRLHPSPEPTNLSISKGSPDAGLSSRKALLAANRISAAKCRQRRKESTSKLTDQHSVLSKANDALRNEEAALRKDLLDLRHQILSHAGCRSSLIDRYIQMTAGSQLGAESKHVHTRMRADSGHDGYSFSESDSTGSAGIGSKGLCATDGFSGSPCSSPNTDSLVELLTEYNETSKA